MGKKNRVKWKNEGHLFINVAQGVVLVLVEPVIVVNTDYTFDGGGDIICLPSFAQCVP